MTSDLLTCITTTQMTAGDRFSRGIAGGTPMSPYHSVNSSIFELEIINCFLQ